MFSRIGNVQSDWECSVRLVMFSRIGNVQSDWECSVGLGMFSQIGNVQSDWECSVGLGMFSRIGNVHSDWEWRTCIQLFDLNWITFFFWKSPLLFTFPILSQILFPLRMNVMVHAVYRTSAQPTCTISHTLSQDRPAVANSIMI